MDKKVKNALFFADRNEEYFENSIEGRRGAPFGAAASIAKGVWGHQPPSMIYGE
jgi:hypothetical protein